MRQSVLRDNSMIWPYCFVPYVHISANFISGVAYPQKKLCLCLRLRRSFSKKISNKIPAGIVVPDRNIFFVSRKRNGITHVSGIVDRAMHEKRPSRRDSRSTRIPNCQVDLPAFSEDSQIRQFVSWILVLQNVDTG